MKRQDGVQIENVKVLRNEEKIKKKK